MLPKVGKAFSSSCSHPILGKLSCKNEPCILSTLIVMLFNNVWKIEISLKKCIPDRYEIKNNGRQCGDSKSDQSKKGGRAEVERILDTFQLACYPPSTFLGEELFDCHKYLSNLDLEHYVLHLLQGAGLLVVPLLLHLANNLQGWKVPGLKPPTSIPPRFFNQSIYQKALTAFFTSLRV